MEAPTGQSLAQLLNVLRLIKRAADHRIRRRDPYAGPVKVEFVFVLFEQVVDALLARVDTEA